MCQVWDLQCKTREAVTGPVDSVVGGLAGAIADAQSALITTTVTWWLYLPPVNAGGAPAAHTLQRWMLPFAVLVVTGGILWQSLLLIINRKGEPLIAIVKGLFATAMWGAVSLTGAQLLIQACDAWTEWVLTYGLNCEPGISQDVACKTDALGQRMQFVLTPASPVPGVLIIIVAIFALLASITQAMLLLFRNGAVIVLAGMLQLAAAGSFTSATSNWLRRVLGWFLALTFYEPFAATTYAVAFMLVGDRQNTDVATWFTGVAMLVLSIIALPAMMKFFNWTVGAVQTTGGTAGMLAATGAAGMHAVASQRGAAGGLSATDYARDLDRRHQDTSGKGGGNASMPGFKPPSFTGPSPATPSAGAPAGATAGGFAGASTGATGAGTAGAGAATAGAGAAAGGAGAGAGAGMAATAGAAAAAGPAAPIVAAGLAVGKAVGTAAKSAADTATRSTEG